MNDALQNPSGEPRFRLRGLGYLVAIMLFALDQISKYLVLGPLDLATRGQITLMPFLDFTWVANYGVSMGFLTANSDSARWLLVAVTGIIALGIIVWLWFERDRYEILALGAILGGAAGNIVDRARQGYVTDFIDFHIGDFRPFLVFNVADAAISIGVVVLIVRALFSRPVDDGATTPNRS